MGSSLLSRLRTFFGKNKEENIEAKTVEKTSKSVDRKSSDKPFMPWSEIPKEKESELIDEIARQVVNYGFQDLSVLLLEVVRPMSFVGSRLGLNYMAPFLEFFGIKGAEYTILFEKEENVKRLIRRINELRK